jgi:hypothetical protein
MRLVIGWFTKNAVIIGQIFAARVVHESADTVFIPQDFIFIWSKPPREHSSVFVEELVQLWSIIASLLV